MKESMLHNAFAWKFSNRCHLPDYSPYGSLSLVDLSIKGSCKASQETFKNITNKLQINRRVNQRNASHVVRWNIKVSIKKSPKTSH